MVYHAAAEARHWDQCVGLKDLLEVREYMAERVESGIEVVEDGIEVAETDIEVAQAGIEWEEARKAKY